MYRDGTEWKAGSILSGWILGAGGYMFLLRIPSFKFFSIQWYAGFDNLTDLQDRLTG